MDMSKKNPSKADLERGKRLEELFRLHNLSDADVARSMGRKSRAVPGRWRAGESFPSAPEDVQKLARILGTTTEYILYGTGPSQISTSSYSSQELPLKETRTDISTPIEPQPETKSSLDSAELLKFFMEQSKEQQALIKQLQNKISDLETTIKDLIENQPIKQFKKVSNGYNKPGE